MKIPMSIHIRETTGVKDRSSMKEKHEVSKNGPGVALCIMSFRLRNKLPKYDSKKFFIS